ncbi:tRNA (guanine-N(7)-)-methyltransferase isoform X1 [Pseudopipra pipra]|uniref:tRNA (guanine-N(7)-)-methyltransferase isoform X1 n=1 Tax=Pseudopipra pipra TaxID=415032 RepID=UPI00313942A0
MAAQGGEEEAPVPPQKRFYRQRAHSNPLADHTLRYGPGRAVPPDPGPGAGAPREGGCVHAGAAPGAPGGPARPLRQRGLCEGQRHETPAPLLPQGTALQAVFPVPRPPFQAHEAQVEDHQPRDAGGVRLRAAAWGRGPAGAAAAGGDGGGATSPAGRAAPPHRRVPPPPRPPPGGALRGRGGGRTPANPRGPSPAPPFFNKAAKCSQASCFQPPHPKIPPGGICHSPLPRPTGAAGNCTFPKNGEGGAGSCLSFPIAGNPRGVGGTPVPPPLPHAGGFPEAQPGGARRKFPGMRDGVGGKRRACVPGVQTSPSPGLGCTGGNGTGRGHCVSPPLPVGRHPPNPKCRTSSLGGAGTSS